MNIIRVWTVMENEWRQIFSRAILIFKFFLGPILITPFLIVVLNKTVKYADRKSMMADIVVTALMLLLPAVAMTLATNLSAGSIVGEKRGRCLEPLLATPVTTPELLLGKMTAAILPALLEIWACYLILVVGADQQSGFQDMVVNGTWFVTLFLVSPLLVTFSESLTLMVSARSKDAASAHQTANQIVSAASMIIPVVLLYGKFSKKWVIDPALMFKIALILFVINILLFFLTIRLFRRETIISTWE